MYKASDHVVAVSQDWYVEPDNLEKILTHKTLTYFHELTTKEQNMHCVTGESRRDQQYYQSFNSVATGSCHHQLSTFALEASNIF